MTHRTARPTRAFLPRVVPALLGLLLQGAATIAGAQTATIEWPRIEVSVAERRLWVVNERGDSLFTAPIAVGRGTTLKADGRSWTFRTPLGATVVTAKEVAPDWMPPDWHYVELAREKGLRLERLPRDSAITLADGNRLVVLDTLVGLVDTAWTFRDLPATDDLIFGGALYIPPFGTRNRSIPGVLGAFRLQLGNGIGLHGTPDTASIGKAATHGCIRLRAEDITWLHENIPVGTRVIIR